MYYTVFAHSISCLYKTSVCSKVTVFYILSSLLTFIPPLLITYRSHGFWKRVDVYREQPEVHYKHEVLVLLDSPQRAIGWSTNKNFNQLLSDNARVPFVKSFEVDQNHDGLMDGLELTLEMPLRQDENIFGIHLFLFFDVKLHWFSSVHFEGMIYSHSSFGLEGSGYHLVGDLNIVQKQPIAHKGRNEIFATPIINPSVFADSFDFATILRNYNARNLTVRLTNEYLTWQRGSRATEPFVANIIINYSEQDITYKLGFWQMIKWAWVQYVSVLIVSVFVFRRIKTFVFSAQILPTQRCLPQLKQHQTAAI